MKKLIVAVAAMVIAVMLGAQTVSAANDVYVGSTKLDGVTLVSFSYNGDLHLVTSGSAITTSNTNCGAGLELVNGACVAVCAVGQERVNGACVAVCEVGQERVNGACVAVCEVGQERVNGACVAVCEVGQERVNGSCVAVCGEGQVRNTSGQCVNQNTTNLCANPPAGVVCGYHIADADWASKGSLLEEVIIPANKGIVASRFKTSSGNSRYGSFNFTLPTNYRTDITDVWISATPGGPALNNSVRCAQYNRSKIYSLTWSQFANSTKCSMLTGTEYYINLRHVDPAVPATRVVRNVQKIN